MLAVGLAGQTVITAYCKQAIKRQIKKSILMTFKTTV